MPEEAAEAVTTVLLVSPAVLGAPLPGPCEPVLAPSLVPELAPRPEPNLAEPDLAPGLAPGLDAWPAEDVEVVRRYMASPSLALSRSKGLMSEAEVLAVGMES